MRSRQVVPEILDSLPPGDARARRARRDLALINAVMGNYRWITRQWRRPGDGAGADWFELGSGDGPLAAELDEGEASQMSVTGVDFAPRPQGWPSNWRWLRGDLFETLGSIGDSDGRAGLLANLFLHHFEDADLGRLGQLIQDRFDRVICVEPARYRVFHWLSFFFFPLVNGVTRHDMQISIGAGFRKGELASLFGLSSDWKVRESVSLLGGYRFEAWKGASV